MLGRRLVARVCSLALVTGVAVLAVATPAQAAGSCSIVVPTKVRVDAPYERINASLGADCSRSGVVDASWDMVHPREGLFSYFLFYDGDRSDYVDFYGAYDTFGRYTIEPDFAYDSDYDDVSQPSVVMDVRVVSRLGLTTKRVGSKVTLTVAAQRYLPTVDGYRAWAGGTITLQYKSCTSCSWVTLSTRKAGSTGKVTQTFTQSKARYYRALSSTTAATWGWGSNTSRR